jgi:hypothetical protein
MAWTGVFCTLNDALYKAGANVNATSGSEAYGNAYAAQAESYINSYCNYNYSDAYGALNADKKGILTEAASCLIAIYMISYDISGFGLATAQTMLNVLWGRVDKCLELLKVENVNKFVKAA